MGEDGEQEEEERDHKSNSYWAGAIRGTKSTSKHVEGTFNGNSKL